MNGLKPLEEGAGGDRIPRRLSDEFTDSPSNVSNCPVRRLGKLDVDACGPGLLVMDATPDKEPLDLFNCT